MNLAATMKSPKRKRSISPREDYFAQTQTINTPSKSPYKIIKKFSAAIEADLKLPKIDTINADREKATSPLNAEFGTEKPKKTQRTSPNASTSFQFFNVENISPGRLRKALGEYRKERFKKDYIFNFVNRTKDETF